MNIQNGLESLGPKRGISSNLLPRKLTARAPEMDGWKTGPSFWKDLFSAMLVVGKVELGKYGDFQV